MKRVSNLLTGVLYFIIVFLGIMILAAVQLRSPSGATFDTWRMQYKANRFLNDNLVKELKKAREKAKEGDDGVMSNEACLRFFDKQSGLPKVELLDKEKQTEIAEAKQKHEPYQNTLGGSLLRAQG